MNGKRARQLRRFTTFINRAYDQCIAKSGGEYECLLCGVRGDKPHAITHDHGCPFAALSETDLHSPEIQKKDRRFVPVTGKGGGLLRYRPARKRRRVVSRKAAERERAREEGRKRKADEKDGRGDES